MAPGGRLASLPNRPPTPPRDFSSSDPVLPVQDGKALSSTLLGTPETPIAFKPQYFSEEPPSRGKKRKRVNFVLTPTHHSSDLSSSPPSLPTISPRIDRAPLTSRDTNLLTKPCKSILKTPRHVLSPLLAAGSCNSPALSKSLLISQSEKIEMVDQSMEKIATGDKSQRLEAYQSLYSVIRKSPDLMKSADFMTKVPHIWQAIHGDLLAAFGADHRDGQLATESLKIASTLVWCNVLPETELSVILDWSITNLGSKTASKNLISNLLLFIKSIQRSKTFTASRVAKLVENLIGIDSRFQGRQLQIMRFELYEKILVDHKAALIPSARSWIRQLLGSLLKERKDLYQVALRFGRAAAVALGNNRDVAKTAVSVFQEPGPTQSSDVSNQDNDVVIAKPYAVFFVSKMLRLLGDRSQAEKVAQIWPLVVMLLRHRSASFRKWEYWGQWLTILQKCFNSADMNVKCLASVAWRELIWASQDELMTDSNMRKSLFRPIQSLLDRDEQDALRTESEFTFCAFLYHSLPRSLTTNGNYITDVWQEYIAKILNTSYTNRTKYEFAIRLLGSLLRTDEHQIWDRDRTLEATKLDEKALPRLDPHWIRANIELVSSVLATQLHQLDEPGQSSATTKFVLQSWDNLLSFIGELSRREIRPTTATVRALTVLLKFVLGRTSNTEQSQSFHKTTALLLEAIIAQKGLPLTLECLKKDTQCLLLPESQPVHSAVSISTLDFVLELFLSPWSERLDTLSLIDAFTMIVTRKLEAIQPGTAALAELASISECYIHCDLSPERGYGSEPRSFTATQMLWVSIKSLCDGIIAEPSSFSSDLQTQKSIELVRRVMLSGFQAWSEFGREWDELLETLSKEAVRIGGPGGLLLLVVSPLLEHFQQKLPRKSFEDAQDFLNACPRVLKLIRSGCTEMNLQTACQSLYGLSTCYYDDGSHVLRALPNVIATLIRHGEPSTSAIASEAWSLVKSGSIEIPVSEDVVQILAQIESLASISTQSKATEQISKSHHNTPRTRQRSRRRRSLHHSDGDLTIDISNHIESHISSSPPELNSSDREISGTALGDALPSDAYKHDPASGQVAALDTSPTPARQLSRPSNESLNLGTFMSSPLLPTNKLHMPTDLFADRTREIQSSPLAPKNQKSRKRRRMTDSRTSESLSQKDVKSRNNSRNACDKDEIMQTIPHPADTAGNVDDMISPTSSHSRASNRKTRKANKKAKTCISSPIQVSKPEITYTTGKTESSLPPRAAKLRSQYSSSEEDKRMIKLSGNQGPRRTVRPKNSSGPASSQSADPVIISDSEDCIVVASQPASQQTPPSRTGLHAKSMSQKRSRLTSAMERKKCADENMQVLNDSYKNDSTPSRVSSTGQIENPGSDNDSVRHVQPHDTGLGEEADLQTQHSGVQTPKHEHKAKRRKLSVPSNTTPTTRTQGLLSSPSAALSATAQGILGRLRGLVGDVSKIVLGRGEAKEFHRTLHKLNAAALEAEERGEAQQE